MVRKVSHTLMYISGTCQEICVCDVDHGARTCLDQTGEPSQWWFHAKGQLDT
jgi:hypothetical protein